MARPDKPPEPAAVSGFSLSGHAVLPLGEHEVSLPTTVGGTGGGGVRGRRMAHLGMSDVLASCAGAVVVAMIRDLSRAALAGELSGPAAATAAAAAIFIYA